MENIGIGFVLHASLVFTGNIACSVELFRMSVQPLQCFTSLRIPNTTSTIANITRWLCFAFLFYMLIEFIDRVGREGFYSWFLVRPNPSHMMEISLLIDLFYLYVHSKKQFNNLFRFIAIVAGRHQCWSFSLSTSIYFFASKQRLLVFVWITASEY